MNDLDEPDSIVPPALREPEHGPPRTWVAVVLTILFIGSGHIVRGRWQRGLSWNFARFATLPLFLRWTVPSLLVLLALHVVAIVDAVRTQPLEPRPRAGKAWLLCLALFAADITVAVTIRDIVVQSFTIPSGSMIPTLQVGDHIFVAMRRHTPERGDVIVFHNPREPKQELVKRVIAVGGDTIEAREDGQIILNGRALPQTSLGDYEYQDFDAESAHWETSHGVARSESLGAHDYQVIYGSIVNRRSTPPVTVPPDSYYVLGDNRDNSSDSRYWGFVPRALVVGTVMRVWQSDGPHGERWERVQQPVR